nr:MAG TPA: hypothetical protein [Caudoviricetes sp.]
MGKDTKVYLVLHYTLTFVIYCVIMMVPTNHKMLCKPITMFNL